MIDVSTFVAKSGGVVPVITLNSADVAPDLADALHEGGCGVLEITLRTPAALGAIQKIAEDRPGIMVGAGTVLTDQDAEASVAAGADFLVSPGFSTAVHEVASATDTLYLPGVATVTEAMTAFSRGYTFQKLFPAEVVGGAALIRALGSVLPEVRFCPTGGIDADNYLDYLALSNVDVVGGSWLTPGDLVDAGKWALVTQQTREVLEQYPRS